MSKSQHTDKSHKPDKPNWNVLLYALAGDDAELKRVNQAVDDMHRALTTSRCNVGVQVHAKSKTTRYWISAGHKLRTEVLPHFADASDPATLTSFLNAAHRNAPDRATALVLWAHSSGLDHVHAYPKKPAARQPGLESVFGEGTGTGPGPGPGLGGGAGPGLGGGVGVSIGEMPGKDDAHGHAPSSGDEGHVEPSRRRPDSYGCRWGPDPNTAHYLTNVGMKKAIAASARRRVELLGLNACWMASLEIQFELRNVSDVLVASQVEALPWPYGAIITALSTAPAQTAETLATAIVDSVKSEIAAGKRYDTISALRCGPAMDELSAAFDAYAKRVTALIESDWESVAKAVTVEAPRVDDPDALDLMALIHKLGRDDLKAKIAAAAVASKFQSVCVASAASTAHPHVHGLSIFCPRNAVADLAAAYRGTEFKTNSWASFLQRFQRKLKATA
jgi:hypothetical protein